MSLVNLKLLTEMFNKIDIGMMLINEDDKICLWNSFLTRHSLKLQTDVSGQNLFDVFPSLPKLWLSMKFKGVRQLQNTSKVSWEQRPLLFEFDNGGTMMQNCSFIPVIDPETKENYICITIQDVSSHAKDKLELKEILLINKSLEEISNTDPLTGIFNRRYICEALEEQVLKASERNLKLAVLMFDLDYFKLVNDNYGHIVGDRVLKYVADTVCGSMMKNSSFGRYGGEEFILFFSGYSIRDVQDWAEKIRIKISEGAVDSREGDIHITASFGIAQYTPEIKDDLEIIHNADVAMYRSKEKGRNRVTLY
ncbi:MAG: GGDEF domain-containing protein [Spirochaetaceae bacterium]|nr:GGDEF domain-containing protein [Spirochaetaceae bacterium]